MVKRATKIRLKLIYKTLTLLLVGLVFLSDSVSINAQCFGSINLYNQADVDNFTKYYGNCKYVNELIIWNENGSIDNIDSLYRLEEVGTINFVYGGIKSYKGLDNLRKALGFSISIDSIHEPFKMLDSVHFLSVTCLNDNVDLSMLSSVRSITRLGIAGNGKLSGLSPFKCGGRFEFVLARRSIFTDDFENLMPQDRIYNSTVSLLDISNQTLNGLANMDNAEYLGISRINNCDISALNNLRNVDEVRLNNLGERVVYGDGISNAFTLESIALVDQFIPFNFGDLFPNIKKIDRALAIDRNYAPINVDVLRNLPAITGQPWLNIQIGTFSNLSISRNTIPIECIMPIVCRTLRERPSFVFIQDNSDTSCDRATILASCLSSTTDTGSDEDLVAYPNPFDQELSIPSSDHLSIIAIYNTAGQCMELDYIDKDRLDTSTWPTGMYILQYAHKEKLHYQKVVKQ